MVETDLAFPEGETIYQQYKYNEILDSNSYRSSICKFQTCVKCRSFCKIQYLITTIIFYNILSINL